MGIAIPPAAGSAQEQLLARLGEERTVEALNRLLDRIEVIAFAVEALDGFLGRAEVVAENVAESMADLRTLAASPGTGDVIGKLPQLARAGSQLADVTAQPGFQRLVQSGLLERLGDQATIDKLGALLERLDVALLALDSLDGFLRRSDEISQALSDDVDELRDSTKPTVLRAKEVLAAIPALVEAGETLVQSGMLERKTVSVLGTIGRSAAQSFDEAKAQKGAPQHLGVFGLLRALRDPDIARAIDFALRVSKAYGQSLK